jgi:bifunctional non-homologous end joining protein LigD
LGVRFPPGSPRNINYFNILDGKGVLAHVGTGTPGAQVNEGSPGTKVARPESEVLWGHFRLTMMYRPMPLVRIPEPFNHPDWLFEVKHDGFRALAHVEGHSCRLVSRNGHEFNKWDVLKVEIGHSVRAMSAVLDGEIVCLDRDGCSNFYSLMFRRDWPYFYAFDVLSIDGEDLRDRPLIERKRRLRTILPRIDSRLLYVDDLPQRGIALFNAACRRDLEGIVGKWRDGRYETDGVSTSWLKIKNPHYSQMAGRREVFEAKRDRRQSRRHNWCAPVLRLRTSAQISDQESESRSCS